MKQIRAEAKTLAAISLLLALIGASSASPAAKVDPQNVVRTAASCRSITHPGSAGKIDVQTTDTSDGPVVAWGITMYDMKESIGQWDVDTYLNGKKTTSGFHRTTTTPYIPHGSVLARSGQRFNVRATLLSASGHFYTDVPNECSVP